MMKKDDMIRSHILISTSDSIIPIDELVPNLTKNLLE